MDHKKKETWKRMDKFFLECILVYLYKEYENWQIWNQLFF